MIGKKMTALTGSAQTHPSSSHKAAPGDRAENIAVIKAAIARTGQPLVSIPLDWSSLRMMRFIHADTDASPSNLIACLIPSSKLGSTRSAICLLPLALISLVDTCLTPGYFLSVSKCMTRAYQKTTPRQCLEPLSGRLTKPLIGVTVMAMNKHTQTRPKYQYRLLAVSRQDRSVPPSRLCTGAGSEQAVRCLTLSPADPLPVQEVQNA